MPHTDSHYDAIVIGLGGHGSASLYHLAKKGLRVLGLEKHSVAHTFGSSHGESRITRMAYHEHPDYVPLLLRSWDLWKDLERVSNKGVLSQGGVLASERCIATHIDQAVRAGAVVHLGEAVLGWHAGGGGGVKVWTAEGVYTAKKVIIAAGAYITNLVPELKTLRDGVQAWFKGSDGKLLKAAVCMFTNTTDCHFIVDTHPLHDEVILLSPCSGHGFKFCSVIGELVSELVTKGRYDINYDLVKIRSERPGFDELLRLFRSKGAAPRSRM